METGSSGPAGIRDRQDFAGELTRLRERSGLTIRQVAAKTGVLGAHSTIGDWFAGRGLPSASSAALLIDVLAACGVDDADQIEQWLAAWRRVRQSPGRRPGSPEPYRGLMSFQPEDADWFFGRDALTRELLTRLTGLHTDGGGIQVLVGASGSGKSSLLRAGVIAAVRAGELAGSAQWPVLLMVPGRRPLDELTAGLEAITADSAGRESAAQADTVLVVVDQFEELFTVCADEEARRAFIAALAAIADAGMLVLIGLRADFYAEILRYPQLVVAVQAGQVAVGPMSESQLREAIVEPSRRARLDIEDGLVELLLRDVAPPGASRERAHDPGALPLLSHALYATWSQGRGRKLTIADYRMVGGIHGSVAASADDVYDNLRAHEQELARRLFLGLVHVAADTADTRRRVVLADLLSGHDEAQAAQAEVVLDRFLAQRLVTADLDTVEISHEALLTAWPRLRAWLESDRAGLVIARRLADAATNWLREQRDPAALYRGTRLAAAQEWVDTAGPYAGLTPLAVEFLDASRRRELDEQRAARRRTHRLRQLVAGFAVLFVLAVAAGAVAVKSQRSTREQRDIAISAKVANEATALRTTNPALAAQLSLAAYQLAPKPEARGSLLSTFATPYSTRLNGLAGAAYVAEFSPDGRLLVTAGTDRILRLWDVNNRHRPTILATATGHTAGIFSAVFSPDGRTLATSGADNSVRLWNLRDPLSPSEITTIAENTAGVRRAAFSPDGRTLATAGYDHTARLWDVSDPRHVEPLATLSGHTAGVTAAVFSPDGRTLATVGNDKPIRLWDLADLHRPRQIAVLNGHTDRVLSAAFSPDGHMLATGGFDNTVRLWDVRDPQSARPLTVLTGHSNGVVAVAFAPDGSTVATGSYDLTVRLWDIADLRLIGAPVTLSGHAETVYSVAFSPDGRTIASASRDSTVRLWDIGGPVVAGHNGPVHSAVLSPDGHMLAANTYRAVRLWNVGDAQHPKPLATLTGHSDNVLMSAFSQDGRMLVTGSLDRTIQIWDLADPSQPELLATAAVDTDNVFAVAFSPDGRTVVTGDANWAVRVWDVTDPRRPAQFAVLTGHTDRVLTVEFSPDGHTIASSSADRTVRLWDLRDRRSPTSLATAIGHDNGVADVAFSPDGRTMATGSSDHTARLWDVTDLRNPRPLSTLAGHSNGVNSVAFSPDGRTLATASFDGTVRVWDISEPGRPSSPITLTGHTDRVTSVAFGPDGHTMVTGSTDATARLWTTDVAWVSAQVCSVAFPRITHAEWRQYFPDLPYRPPCG